MARIHLLDKSIAERIAAGEVVERPASVIKELIENAIDAEARAISIEIRQGGVALIRVSDNGSGMSREDAALAVERFATSKITAAEDLNAIKTLGFRGEALPSIASVAQLEILTRARPSTPLHSAQDAQDIEGTRIRVIDGQVESAVAGAPIGTQVTVRELFYNAPARRKFLKSPLRETELIQKTIVTYALAYPHIAVRFIADGRESLSLPAATPLERIGAIWGRDVAGEMIAIDHTEVDLHVRGFISRPTLARASREWQFFFVNQRPIRSGLLAVMLERPYAGRLPLNRHPLAVIQIEIDPQLVDVNVHPRKAEVRFYQERAIYNAVTHAVEAALREFPLLPSDTTTDWSFADAPYSTDALREARVEYGLGPWRAIGQIHNTYILAQSLDGMAIVDQHAAQEQIFFERLTTGSRIQEAGSKIQDATPKGRFAGSKRQIEVMPHEAELIGAHLEEYRSIGIELESFGSNTFRVLALPEFVKIDPVELITALLQEHDRYRTLDGDALRDKLASKAACLSAIKAGDVLDHDQQQALLDELLRIYSPATCPHGRPTFVTLRLEELERRLGRR
ncbi:MAG TPA: DNA mismatch repair endonuclease MutL [Anaerolineae bacterium]|nr:DNA mismatch repair endonuclease MutL [Anaerolineae bacterium]